MTRDELVAFAVPAADWRTPVHLWLRLAPAATVGSLWMALAWVPGALTRRWTFGAIATLALLGPLFAAVGALFTWAGSRLAREWLRVALRRRLHEGTLVLIPAVVEAPPPGWLLLLGNYGAQRARPKDGGRAVGVICGPIPAYPFEGFLADALGLAPRGGFGTVLLPAGAEAHASPARAKT